MKKNSNRLTRIAMGRFNAHKTENSTVFFFLLSLLSFIPYFLLENFASRYHSSRDMVIAWQTLEFILHEWVLNLLFFSLRCLVMLRLSRTLSAFVYHPWAVVGADQLIVSSLYINISLKEKSCFCSRRRRRRCFFNLWKLKPRNMQKQACKTSKTQREKAEWVKMKGMHKNSKNAGKA